MTLGIRKLTVLGLVAAVVVSANALLLAHWLDEIGVINWAGYIRHEFLTGTAITILLALLILLVPARQVVAEGHGYGRRCAVCGHGLREGKYCAECGSRA